MLQGFIPRFYAEDDGAPQGGGDDEGGVAASFRARLAKTNGDAQEFAMQLYHDNYKLRQRNGELRAKVPADGAVTLSVADAARWSAYTALGAPETLTAALAEGTAATATATRLERAQTVRDAAALVDYRPAALARLIGDLPLVVADGKAMVTTETGPVELTAHAAQAWAEFLPALAATPSSTPLPTQQGGQVSSGDAVAQAAARMQQQRDAAHNPLAPRAAAPSL